MTIKQIFYDEYGFKEVWTIVFMILGSMLVFAFIIFFSFVMEDVEKVKCSNSCEKYNAEFIMYEDVTFSSDECWCKKEGMPLRIY